MRKYIFKRLIYMVIALFCIITLTFFLMRIAPGNPFASEHSSPAQQAVWPEQPLVYPVQRLPSGHSQVRLRLFHEVPGPFNQRHHLF